MWAKTTPDYLIMVVVMWAKTTPDLVMVVVVWAQTTPWPRQWLQCGSKLHLTSSVVAAWVETAPDFVSGCSMGQNNT